MVNDALFEIYVEELPSGYISPVISQIERLTENLLKEFKIDYKEVNVFATPRRIAVLIKDLDEKTKEEKKEIVGPPLKIAFTQDNRPTEAALGFAKNNGISINQLQIKETPKGKYLCAIKIVEGRKTEEILPELFIKIVSGINFPKTMIWEETKFKFARPIRNLLALYGTKSIKFKLAGIKSNNWTYGFEVYSPKKIKISTVEKYLQILRNNHILVDQNLRYEILKKVIETSIKKISDDIKKECRAVYSNEILDEINYLVEYPTSIICKYPEKYLELPKDFLVKFLQKKHRFICVADLSGRLTNYFIGIRNGTSENQTIVREGYEKVVCATLEDAQFFYNQDIKTPLASKVEKLKNLIFHEKLGSVKEKTDRVKILSEYLFDIVKEKFPGVLYENVIRCAELSKVDLATNIVYEHPDLQGVAGRVYAKYDGEQEEVSRGIEEHYYPLVSEGPLPETPAGIIVSLADKMDTITADFSAGLIPTGSADPYGLRRQAIGVIRIIREKKIDIELDDFIRKSISLLPEKIVDNKDRIHKEVLQFFVQRLEGLLQNDGFNIDEIRAVLKTDNINLLDIDLKISALKKAREIEEFKSLIIGFKRVSNILNSVYKDTSRNIPVEVDTSCLLTEEEKSLHGQYLKVSSIIRDYLSERKYDMVIKELINLRSYIDVFFDKVLVMDKDEKIKNNRLNLLRKIDELFKNIADFSLLQ